MSWYWHDITDKDSARYATDSAVWVSYLIAIVSGLIATFSLLLRRRIAGMNGWGLIDAGLFLIVAWRIAALSRTWAVFGLLLFAIEASVATLERIRTSSLTPPILAIIFLTTYINAVRGAFAFRRYTKLEPH